MKRVGAAAILALALWAAYWNLKLARAESAFRAGDPGQAARLAPWNSLYRGVAGDVTGALTLNPLDSTARIERALALEAGGELKAAEADLCEAARTNRQWEPRWALANFYARRGDRSRFWSWASEAARVSFPGRTAFYRLAAAMSDRPTETLERIVRPHPRLAADYLRFALESGTLAPAAGAAALVIASGERDQLPLLLEACDAMMSPDWIGDAKSIWDRMSRSGWFPHDSGLLPNGDFRLPLLPKGFDWRPSGIEGTNVRTPASTLIVELNGRQPERCELISHYAALAARRRYRLDWQGELPPGFVCRVLAFDGGTIAADTSRPPAVFAGERLVRIVLAYERPAGHRRYEGEVKLNRVSLEQLP